MQMSRRDQLEFVKEIYWEISEIESSGKKLDVA
jgi:hypothetical protein